MMKRIIAVCCAVILTVSTVAFAAAVRVDWKKSANAEKVSRSGENDIIFQDFTSVSSGLMPSGVIAGNSNITTAQYEVMPGYKKNCLEIRDTDHSSSSTQQRATMSLNGLTGLFGVEIRYKYIPEPDTTSDYSAFVIRLMNAESDIASRLAVASGNGNTYFNYGGEGSAAVESFKLTQDNWYTAKWIVDTDDGSLDFSFKNEGTGKVTSIMEASYYEEGVFDSISKLDMYSSVYGGIYVIDYIRISKETDRLGDNTNIVKGVEAEKINAPANKPVSDDVNIKVDGKFVFTTAKPYATDKGNVMATAKNLAGFFDAEYVRIGNIYSIQKKDKSIVFDVDLEKTTVNGTVSKVSTKKEGHQLFVDVKVVSEALGYNYSFDSGAKIAEITSNNDEEAK